MTTPGDGDEAPVGLKETKTGRAHAEKREHAVDDALADGRDFEALGERPGHPAQLLGFPPALLRLLVEACILERDRGLGGEVAERSELLLAERVGRLAEPEHADDAEQPVADDQRLDDRVPSADADELRLGIRRCGIVVDEAALPLEGAGADETDAEGDALIDRGALAPGARCQRVARGLHQVDRALGPEETTGMLHDQREQPIEVELGGQLALHRGQRLDVGPARRLQREEPRVLQRERRLVGKGLGQPDVGLVEGPPGPIADAERTDDPIVHDERHGEHGAIAGRLDPRAGVVTQLDARIVQDVGSDDRPTVANGEAAGPGAPGENDPVESRADVARDGHRLDVTGLRQQPIDSGGARLQQRAHAVGDALGDDVGVERGGEQALDVGQRGHALGVAVGLTVEARVLEGNRRLSGKRLGQLLIARAEAAPGAERQDADHAIPDPERDAQVMRVAELALALPVLRHHVDRAGLDHQRSALGDDLAAEALADLDPRTDHRLFRGAGEPGQHEHVALDEPEAGVVDVEQARRLLGDGAEERVGRLFGADLFVDVEERRHLISARLLFQEQARVVDGDGGVVGQGLQQLELLDTVVTALAYGGAEHAQDALADHHRHARHRHRALGTQALDIADARVVLRIEDRLRPPRGGHRADQPVAEREPGHADDGRGRPGAGAKDEVLAVVLDEPQARNARVEDPHAGVDNALEHLFERQRPREGLGQPRQALELSTLLFGLGAQRGLSDGGVEQQGDRFEPAVRVPGESAIVGREQEQHAPGRLADVDGHRDLGAIAEGRVLGPDGDDPATAKGVAEAGPVDRPRRKGLDALVRHAALGNEREPSAARLESVDDRGRDAHEPADGLERSPKPGRQIRRTVHRAGEGAKRLTVASPLLADP